MSHENVELVRGIYAAWAAGTSARGFMDPDIEYVNPPDAVETGTLRGPGSFGLIRDAYDDVEVRPNRFILRVADASGQADRAVWPGKRPGRRDAPAGASTVGAMAPAGRR